MTNSQQVDEVLDVLNEGKDRKGIVVILPSGEEILFLNAKSADQWDHQLHLRGEGREILGSFKDWIGHYCPLFVRKVKHDK